MIAQSLIVFAALFVLDLVWAWYTTAVTARRRFVAGGHASLIFALGAFATISYFNDPRMIVPAMLGAFCGTVVGIKSHTEPGVDNVP